MSDSEVESNSLFKCDVCLNDYGPLRQQKFLPCLHSFCQSCLTEIQQADGGIKCPICRKLHVVSRDVSSLPSHYFEALKKMEREKNQIISLLAEYVEEERARIRQLNQHVTKLEEKVQKMVQDENVTVSRLYELSDKQFETIVQFMLLNSEKEKEIHQLKEQVAILKNEQN